MKEFLILVVLIIAACVFVACKHKKKEQAKKGLNVEQCISADREFMAANYENFVWYETSVTMKDFLDQDGGSVDSVENIFQVVVDDDTRVVVFLHTETEDKTSVIHSFWAEDFPLENIKVTYQEALEIVNKVNLPKPHSKHCVLKKQVGPKACNPQYIFGNRQSQIYVDAVTGDVSDKNPAFKE